jgi:hypothetical protein
MKRPNHPTQGHCSNFCHFFHIHFLQHTTKVNRLPPPDLERPPKGPKPENLSNRPVCLNTSTPSADAHFANFAYQNNKNNCERSVPIVVLYQIIRKAIRIHRYFVPIYCGAVRYALVFCPKLVESFGDMKSRVRTKESTLKSMFATNARIFIMYNTLNT